MKNNMNEEHFGKGGIESPKDDRDYKYSNLGSSTIPFDWVNGFDIEQIVGKIPVKDQNGSNSCGGQSWATLSYVLDTTNREEKSAKFIFAHTHVGNGGSAGRTNCDLCVKKGVASEKLCSSYENGLPPKNDFMIRLEDITPEAFADALTNKEKSYLSVATNIESIAQAIRDSHGVVIGIAGENNGTWLSAMPKKPKGTDVWRHWMYAGKAKTIAGTKYIGCLNSWGKSVGIEGWQWISEDYFDGNNVWEAWCMAYNDSILNKYIFTKTLKIGSTGIEVKMLQTKLGITADGIFGKNTAFEVKALQFKNNLVPDGIVGIKTREILNK